MQSLAKRLRPASMMFMLVSRMHWSVHGTKGLGLARSSSATAEKRPISIKSCAWHVYQKMRMRRGTWISAFCNSHIDSDTFLVLTCFSGAS